MTFPDAVKTCLAKYVVFNGRASRSEYWFFYLALVLASVVASILDKALGIGIISTVLSLAVILPNIAVGVRRLHDTNRSGWWLLIAFTIIGIIFLIVWFATKGTTGDNQYGSDPLGGDLTAAFS